MGLYYDDNYCNRCDRSFRSDAAERQHIRDSRHHNVCHICYYTQDFPTRHELVNHLEQDHDYCVNCGIQFDDDEELAEHDEDVHNICITCKRSFQTQSNLQNHKLVHLDRNIECPGCPRNFATESAVMLHLEAGTCESGAGLRMVNELAAECYQSQWYECNTPGYDFECPTCDTEFRYMSGLL